MIIDFFYLFFIAALLFATIALVTPLNVNKPIAAALAAIMFLAASMQSLDVQKVHVLEVNGSLVTYTEYITDKSFSTACRGLSVAFFVLAFLTSIAVAAGGDNRARSL